MSQKQREDFIATYFRQKPGMIKFLAIFLILAWAFVYAYQSLFLGSDLYERYFNTCVSAAKVLLEWLGEEVELRRSANHWFGELWSHDGAMVSFEPRLDGIVMLSGLLAAILAWPGALWRKFLVSSVAALLLFLVVAMRVAALLKVAVFFPLYYELVDFWVFPALTAFFAVSIFVCWIKFSGQHPFDQS